ncbi:MAG: xanthine dehydrogenase family protein molybdopterin-binding subunit [Alphaproteobacteria bacterium]|nr:xanthine dehydrogenase family protein molybdopterin-binding subunit [Alphaproteobacteria bacterium]
MSKSSDGGIDLTRPKIIGAPVQRLEDPRLLTGHGKFTDDVKLRGTLHVALRRSDHAHARIGTIDTAEAEEMPGVVGVFTAELLDALTRPVFATSKMKDYHATPVRALAGGKVRFAGEPVVAVVAQSRYLAEDALAGIEIDYTPLEPVVDPEEAAADNAVKLHDHLPGNVLVARRFGVGDVEQAMGDAPIKVGGRFRFHRKTPTALEARSYLADYDQGTRALTLYASTQVPGIVRDALVEVLDMPGSKLRVIAGDVGGGFGGKASLNPEEILVCALSRHLGRPVKWTADRVEDLISTSQSFDEIVDAELAVDQDGTFLALKADILGDVGAFSIYPWTAALEPMQVAGFLPGPYRVPNFSANVRAVATNKAPMGPYRGVGRPISAFVLERLVDMAAKKLAMDPKEIRLRNFVKEEEFPHRTGSGIVWDRSGFTECLERAADAINYPALRKRQAEARADGRWLGIGIASYAELTGIGSRLSAAPGMPINTGTESATISVDSSGAVTAHFGIASHGQGLETTLAQIVAEEMGVRLEDVEIVQGDTSAVAHSTGTYASRSAVIAGGAGTLTARTLRGKIIEAASHLLDVDMADIDFADSLISARGTNKTMSLRELARAVYSQMGSLPGDIRAKVDLQASEFYDPHFGTTTSATHLAAVEIDPETYEVSIEKFVVVEDCGRVINPMIVDGQVHGGVAQGIGAALFEEVVHDVTGQNISATLVDYVIPSAAEVPSMEVHHLDVEAPSTLGGYRGMGEGGTIGAPAAIANALNDALSHLGVEIMELPMTPERLFQVISAAQDGEAESS